MLDAAHVTPDTQSADGGVNTLPTATAHSTPNVDAPSADLPPGHVRRDTQQKPAGGDLPADQNMSDTHDVCVGGNNLPAATCEPTPTPGPPLATHDALLLILADALDDLERARIATQNRLRSLEQVKGLGDSREARTMQQVAVTLSELERRATLDLQRALRAHPLGPWVKRTVGIGEKQGARLLAAIGDPATRTMPSQLWQYCGHGAPSKRQRGVKTFWNPTAKMRVHLVAEKAVESGVRKCDGYDDADGYDYAHRKAISPYGRVYLDARRAWADSDTSDGHKHNHALRMVGKAILLDLWREAQREAA